jgi:GNAT superfamily N-acetyltransferase
MQSRAEALLKRREQAEDAVLLRLLDGDTPVGYLGLLVAAEDGARFAILEDVHIEEPYRRQGRGQAAVELAREWARGCAPRLNFSTDPTDPAQLALFKAFPVRSQNMFKTLGEAPTLPDGVTARSMTDEEFQPWWVEQIAGYAESFVLNGILTPEQARERSERQSAELLPEGLATPGHDIFTITAAGSPADAVGTPVAALWVCHGVEPDTSFVFDVVVDSEHRGRGFGRAAMLAAEQATLASGNHKLGLNVFGHNDVALGLYTSLGYRPVSQMRSASL